MFLHAQSPGEKLWKPSRFSSWQHYLLAVSVSLLWFPLYSFLFDPDQTSMLQVFLLPVLLSAYFGGLGPGLLATVIVAVITDYFLLPPYYNWKIDRPIDIARWLSFVDIAILICLISELMHRSRRAAEAEWRRNAVTLASIGDAVITTDQAGRVTFLNLEAERLTGWPLDLARGRFLAEVFHIINEQTHLPVPDPVSKVLATGSVVGLANHTVLLSKDGREIPIDDSGAPIKQEDGKVVGVVLVFRDCSDQKRAEAALGQSEQLYHSLVDHMPAGVFRKDVSGRYVFVNRLFCELRGEQPEQFLGKLPEELPESEGEFRVEGGRHHDFIMRTGKTVEVVDAFHRADGRTLFFYVVKSPVYDGAGKLAGSQGVLIDITDRKQIESTLQRVMAQTRCIINTGTVTGRPGWREHALDVDSSFEWNFPVQNEAAAQGVLPLELAPGELYHQAWRRSRHPTDHVLMNQSAGRALLEGAAFYQNEFRCVDRHGQTHWMQQLVTVEKLAENHWALFGVTTDITELKASQELYRSLFDGSPTGYLRQDEAGRIIDVNLTLGTLTGRRREELIGRPASELAAAGQPRIPEAQRQQILAGGVYQYEMECRLPEGGQRCLAVVETGMGFPDGHREILCNYTDITQRRAAELLQTRQKQILEMIATNQPLPEVLTALCRLVGFQDEGQLSSILLLSPDGRRLTHGAAVGLSEEYCRAIDGVEIGPVVGSCGTAAYRKEPVFVADTTTDPLWENYRHLLAPYGLRACWSNPIFDEQRQVLGTFAIYTREPGLPDEGQQRLMQLAGDMASICIRRHRAENALRDSEARLSTIFHSSPMGIIISTLDTGRIVDANEALAQIFGRSVNQLIGSTSGEIGFWKNDAERTKFIAEFQSGGQSFNREYKYCRPDGKELILLISVESILVNNEKCLLTLIQDFTARKAAELELVRLAAIVQSTDDAIISLNLKGVVMTWNRAAERIYGYSAGEMIGQSILCLLPPDRQGEEEPIWVRVAQGETVEHFETTRARKDGTCINVSMTVSPLREGTGQVVGLSKIVRDITERKRAEELVSREQARFKLIFEAIPIGIAFHTVYPDGTSRRNINAAHLRISGLTREQHDEPDIYTRITHPEDHNVQQYFIRQVKSGAIRQYAMEKRYLRPSGDVVWVKFSYQRELYPDGTVEEFTTVVDITDHKRIENALREVMTHTRCLISMGTAGTGLDGSWRLDFAVQNVEAAQLVLPLELNPGEAYHQAWERSLLPDDREQLLRNARRALQQDAPFYRNEFRCRDRFGGEHWMQQLVTVESAGEKYWRLFGITTDITELKRVEERYRQERSLLRSLIDSIPDLIYFKDLKSVYLGANRAFEKYSGYPATELIGKTDFDLNPPTVAEEYRKTDQEVMRGDAARLIEEWLSFKGGGGLFETIKTPYRNPQGEVMGLIGISRNITERKHTEEQLRKLSRAVEQSSVAIVITDATGQFEYVNPKFTQLTGYELSELVGKTPRLLKSGKTTPEEYKQLWKTITAGGEWRGQFQNRRKDGGLYWETAFISPIFDVAGKITHYLGIKEDITERKRLEDQLRQSQKMEAIGQLAGGIAHDFNNLLTAIHGNASLLLDPEAAVADRNEYSREIVAACERATNLTRQLLLFSRKQALQLADLNLNESVASISRMLERIVGEDIQMVSDLAPDLPVIQADAGMIEQILLNLTVNARDAMPAGGKMTIRTRYVLQEQLPAKSSLTAVAYVSLAVNDTGCGIASADLPRIFDPFFTTKPVGKGTGLGLATVYGIVQQHNGCIDVTSELGQGTTFSIYFPASRREPPLPRAVKALARLPRGTETVLLVEDEAPVRMIIQHLLKRLGYVIHAAANGPEALTIWQGNKEQINLLITDVVMPEGLNGFQLAEQLQADKPKLKVLYASGYTGNSGSRPDHVRDGVNFIQKPFTPEGLAEMIRRVLDNPE